MQGRGSGPSGDDIGAESDNEALPSVVLEVEFDEVVIDPRVQEFGRAWGRRLPWRPDSR